MKRNFIFKTLTVVFVFFLFIMQAFAKNINTNTIDKIIIEPLTNNNYTLKLLFKNEYKGNAFMQKRENGSYLVFIPDTKLDSNNINVIYKNKKDKSKINLTIEERPIQKGKKQSDYVKVSVDMIDDYSLRLMSGLSSDYSAIATFLTNFDFVSAGVILLAIVALYIFRKALKQAKKNSSTHKCYTSYPSAFLNSPSDYLMNVQREAEEHLAKSMLPKMNIKNTIKPADKSSFDCFELPFAEDMKSTNNYEFKSTLQQASQLLKENPSLVKLRHTNPITNNRGKELSELSSMPLVEDIMPKKIKRQEEAKPKQSNAELLSVLNITPNKGFYLTTVDETLALFGFINENVFLFKKFKDLTQINLQARYYDKNGKNDIYIVRLDSYKAMIEISEDSMKELAKI